MEQLEGKLQKAKINEKRAFKSELLQAEAVSKEAQSTSGEVASEVEPVAWFVDWRDDAAVPVLQQLLDRDIHVRVALRPLEAVTQSGEVRFPVGTLSIPMGIKQNRSKRRLVNQILKRAANHGVRVEAVKSGLATTGIDLGSNNFPRIKQPEVAMLVGTGISAYQAGAAWHQLNHRSGIPVTLLDATRVGDADLSRYTTVVLVSGNYNLRSGALEKLQRYVREGGSLIAISGGTAFAQQDVLQLPPSEVGAVDPEVEPEDSEKESPKFSEARRKAALDLVSGAIFATEIDNTHPLMFGFQGKRLPVFRGSTSLLTAATPDVSNPSRYPAEPLMAGYASEENQKKIGGSSAITVHAMGRGNVILIIDDPNFRAFWPATSRVFMNAVFFGAFSNAR